MYFIVFSIAKEATTFAHLDATIALSKGLATKGIYPIVDPLDSTLPSILQK